MTKYGISEECAAIMESFGVTLRNATSGIDANSVKLGEKVGALNSNGRLGIFGDEILNLTNGNRSAVQKVGEDIGVISKKAGDTAGRIRELVSAGLVAPAGGAAGSAGSTAANISNGGSVSAKSGMSETANNKFADSGNGYEKNGSRTASEAAFNGSNNYSGSGTADFGDGNNKYVDSEFYPDPNNSNLVKSEDLDAYLKPEAGATPRSLEKTRLGFRRTRDNRWVYDSPEETSEYLIQEQGQAYFDYQGTCGLCSCANILRQSGVEVSEKEMIDFASTTPMKHRYGKNDLILNEKGEIVFVRENGEGLVIDRTIDDNGDIVDKTHFLCAKDEPKRGWNGGTSPEGRRQILEHFGIESETVPVLKGDGTIDDKTIENIANYLSEGKGVVLSVHAHTLWDYEKPPVSDEHAVVVSSFTMDDTGKILGFYIHDTSHGGPGYYSADKIKESLTGNKMNVTVPIR